jgi:hypothetical protein
MSILARREPRNLYYREVVALSGSANGSEIDCTNGSRLIIALDYTENSAGSLDINLAWNPARDGSGTWTTSTANAASFNYTNNFNDGAIDNVDVDMDLTVTASGEHFFSCPVMGPLARVQFIVTSGTWDCAVEYLVTQGT